MSGTPGVTSRLSHLFVGLGPFGVSLAMMVRARLGFDPWDELHQGLARQADLAIGWVVIAVGAIALLPWIPPRQRPGVGTVSNDVVVVGLALAAGVLLSGTIGVGTIAYAFTIGAQAQTFLSERATRHARTPSPVVIGSLP